MTRGMSPRTAHFLKLTTNSGSTLGSVAPNSQIAPCSECGEHLEFTTGSYGQTLEYCPTLDCLNHAPHAPVRPADAVLITTPPRRVRNTGNRKAQEEARRELDQHCSSTQARRAAGIENRRLSATEKGAPLVGPDACRCGRDGFRRKRKWLKLDRTTCRYCGQVAECVRVSPDVSFALVSV